MAKNTEWVGEAIAKVKVRKRPFQYIGPYHRTFNIDIRQFASQFGVNVRNENVEVDPVMGCIYVKPLMVNRGNYIYGLLPPEEENQTNVPENYINEYTGAASETENERNKRVFRSYPNEFQTLARGDSDDRDAKRGAWVSIDKQEEQSDDFQGPLWGVTLKEPVFDDSGNSEPDSESISAVTWIEQKKAHGNVEWLLMQEYGNFMNESFWIDLDKDAKAEPSGETGNLDKKRYTVYGDSRKIHAYFAVRIGWFEAKDILEDYLVNPFLPFELLNVVNSVASQVGPYDIVFPIDGVPFIFDHQGDTLSMEEQGVEGPPAPSDPWRYDEGFIASEAPDETWILKDDEKNVRLKFYYLRGKLVIRASHASSAWVFPAKISPQANELTKTRYENFSIPPGRVCILGRGFSFRMSYNPLEFNITGEDGDLEWQQGYHGNAIFMPIPERKSFPTGRGGWTDYFQADTGRPISDSGKNGVHNFTLMPDDRYRDPTGTPGFSPLEYKYNCDIVTEPYYGQGVSTAGQITSMMIATNSTNALTPKSGDVFSQNPRDICNTYLRPPTPDEDSAIIDTNDQNYGWDVSIKDAIDVFSPKYPVVELCCRPPTVGPFTENISRRFASPVFWGMMATHVVPDPAPVPWIDISNFISNISYDMSSPDFLTLRQSFNVTLIIPKDYEFGNYSNNPEDNTTGTLTSGTSRQRLLELIYNGVLEVEISLGWLFGDTVDPVLEESSPFNVFKNSDFEDVNVNGHAGRVARIFSGIAQAGPLTQRYDLDTVSLNCTDKLDILEDQIIINSPIYDGMAVDRAFLNVCQLLGLPYSMFDVRSAFARGEVLPVGFTFAEPRVKFQKNTNLLEAAKQIAGYFMHTVRTDPDGKIVLGDIYSDAEDVRNGDYYGAGKKIDDLSISHPSYDFYVEGRVDHISGNTVPNAFQRVYEQFTFNKEIADQLNQLLILTVDRNDGALIMDNRAFDLASIENPEARNFIGYLKAGRYQEAALGDEEHLKKFRDMFANRVFTAPMYVQFSTYGRPTLRPLDIIGVYHSQDLDLPPEIVPGSSNYLKYRITSVKGTLDWQDGLYQYKVDVSAEHL